jgi:hypothetical protein
MPNPFEYEKNPRNPIKPYFIHINHLAQAFIEITIFE